MTVSDAMVEHTLETVQRWMDRGYALFVPETLFCVASVAQQLPDDAILELMVPCRNGSFAPFFMVQGKPLLEGRVSHPDKVRMVLADELLGSDGRLTGLVHVEPTTANDEQVAEILKDMLEAVMEEE